MKIFLIAYHSLQQRKFEYPIIFQQKLSIKLRYNYFLFSFTRMFLANETCPLQDMFPAYRNYVSPSLYRYVCPFTAYLYFIKKYINIYIVHINPFLYKIHFLFKTSTSYNSIVELEKNVFKSPLTFKLKKFVDVYFFSSSRTHTHTEYFCEKKK